MCWSVSPSVRRHVLSALFFFFFFFSHRKSEHPSASYLPPLLHQHALVLPPWRHPVWEFSEQRTCPSSSHEDCPWSVTATWLDIFCGYYRFLQSKPLSTRQEKWDLNSGELQGHSGVLNSSIRLCQRGRNCRTKGNQFPAEFRETAHGG